MSNPVSQIPSAQLPFQDDILTNQNGSATIVFHRFLTGIWQRTGGAVGVNNSDVAQVASQALALAQTASTEATAAEATAAAAEASANDALAQASAAATAAAAAAAAAGSVQNTALLRSQNLADLTSLTAARTNLGLTTFPLTFSFDTCPASLNRGIPLTRSLTLPANFVGTAVWWGIPASSNAVFLVGRSRSPSSTITNIGSITVVGGTGVILSIQAAVTLSAGDTLTVTCPSVPDSSLAQLAFTFPMTIA